MINALRTGNSGSNSRPGVQTWEIHTVIKGEPATVRIEVDFASDGMRRLINRAAVSTRKLATEASGAVKVRIVS